MDSQTNEFNANLKFGDKFERHVVQAFQIADENAGANGITAADMLMAALRLSKNINWNGSKAFLKIKEMIPLELEPSFPESGLLEVKLSSHVLNTIEKSKAYLGNDLIVWGRDYITISLLSMMDPSLQDLVQRVNKPVDQIQDSWFDFVTSDTSRRSISDWEKWWHVMEVPLPNERLSTSYPTYLLTWNPEKYDQNKLIETINKVENNETAILNWSLGNRRNIEPYGNVLLLRQNSQQGIVGVGKIIGEVAESEHWDTKEAAKGKTYRHVPIKWKNLSTIPILTENELINLSGQEQLWRPRGGGTKLSPNLAQILFEAIQLNTNSYASLDSQSYAKTLSDLDHSNDFIGIDSDVTALATLVSINKTKPPLSISIFGDWGSGKTFLMTKIREMVSQLEKRAQQAGNENEESKSDTYVYSSILQIEFNAWHYTESNLWASLVNHIFEKLHEKMSSSEDITDDNERAIEAMFDQLELAQTALIDINNEIDLRDKEVKRLSDNVDAAKDLADANQKSLVSSLGKTVWLILDSNFKGATEESLKLKWALSYFGFDKQVLSSTQTIYETVQKFRTVSGRTQEILGSLLTTRRGIISALLIVTAFVVTAFVVGASEEAKIGLDFSSPILSFWASFLGLLIWVGQQAFFAKDALAAIQEFDQWFAKLKQEKEEALAKDVASAQADYEQSLEHLIGQKKILEEAQILVGSAKDNLEALTARDRLRRFVDHRVTSEMYAKHLGIISMIRKDFESLSKTMKETQQESDLVKRIEEKLRKAIPKVDRVILYIDDLDRCRPDRVVEVLEAIHLLLGFELFIVFVAVDPRWILESLKRRYPHLDSNQQQQLLNSQSQNQNLHNQAIRNEVAATPHDYLEKIFNIPIWVNPMQPEAARKLVSGYFEFEDQKLTDAEVKDTSILEDIPQKTNLTESNGNSNLIGQDEIDRSSETNGPANAPNNIMPIDADWKLRQVRITQEEQIMIGQLAEFLGQSPRRIKRFVNTYRLLKSSLSQHESNQFASNYESSDDYRIVLVFLAIVTGSPTIAPKIFSEAFKIRRNFSVYTLLEAVEISEERTNGLDSTEASNTRNALRFLENIDIDQKGIETWVPRVARYAFRLTPLV